MKQDPSTKLIHTPEAKKRRTVNPAVERASTVLFDTADDLYGPLPTYGRRGLDVHRELENALCGLEQAHSAYLTPSGLTACAAAIASVTEAGGRLLYCDTIYGPTRRFCEHRLPKMGVDTQHFAPTIGAEIETLLTPETQAIMLETPGSLTFEIPDLPAISKIARERGITVVVDNTWSAGLFHKPLEYGADISVQALTKYVVGHADAFGGAIMCASKPVAAQVNRCLGDWGLGLSPDDAYTALRGLRTLPNRLKQHESSALALAKWLEEQPWVSSVLHPALPSDRFHEIWRRDFTGSSGLFGVILKDLDQTSVDKAISRLTLFRLGFSWGGFESLLIPCDQQLRRPDGDWTKDKNGPLIRIHVGLEAVEDLIADLDQAFGA